MGIHPDTLVMRCLQYNHQRNQAELHLRPVGSQDAAAHTTPALAVGGLH